LGYKKLENAYGKEYSYITVQNKKMNKKGRAKPLGGLDNHLPSPAHWNLNTKFMCFSAGLKLKV